MSERHLEVLGVYKPYLPDDIQEWAVEEKGEGYTEGLVLIEALAHRCDGPVDMSSIGQQPSYSDDPNSMLVAYDEALLSSEGETLILRDMGCVDGTGTLRFAFYLECYDPARPLKTPWGDVECPAIQPAPARLMTLMPFNIY